MLLASLEKSLISLQNIVVNMILNPVMSVHFVNIALPSEILLCHPWAVVNCGWFPLK